MIGIIISGHLNFASGIQSAVEAVLGQPEYVTFIDYDTSMSSNELARIYQRELEKYDSTLFLVDLLGGTPCNVASSFLSCNEKVQVVSGVNLPMVLNAINEKDDMLLGELTEFVVQLSFESVKSIRELIEVPAQSNNSSNEVLL
ncbi:PTS sugar transporter subunit IIA [Vibrio mediterranei]|uniref:PTS sugar transporter subunit IIA n=1 Tax=Vibrio mediterranei TaxID=689 RepID=UPI001EFE4A14|nr:PTS sugar transporter subunit IIA [Vibrio mediterranei]MCG9625254.1 PTS sugar transporter subunit IIA [Vibrio mediterranei]